MSKDFFLNHGPTGKSNYLPPLRHEKKPWDRIKEKRPTNINTRFCSLEDLWIALFTKKPVGNNSNQIWQSDHVYTRTVYGKKSYYDDNCFCRMHLGNVRPNAKKIIVHTHPCKSVPYHFVSYEKNVPLS